MVSTADIKVFNNIREVVLSPREKRLTGELQLSDIRLFKFSYFSGLREIDAFMALPGAFIGKIPAVFWNRGGFGNNGRLDDFLAYVTIGEIASWGYGVFASQYRNDDEFGGGDVDDVINLIQQVMDLKFVDSSKLAIEGWSRGGMMTYLLLQKMDIFKAATIISGLSNMKRYFESNPESFRKLSNIIEQTGMEEFLRTRSAVEFYDKLSKETPILLIHSKGDEVISYQDSQEMYDKLNSLPYHAGCELILLDGDNHFLRKNRDFVVKYRRDWLKKHLN
ncbi:MAG: alpha/beta hydrolase family protein [Ignavibacteria bacterium]